MFLLSAHERGTQVTLPEDFQFLMVRLGVRLSDDSGRMQIDDPSGDQASFQIHIL